MKIRPDIFLVSDTHFGHQQMVNWGHRTRSHNEDIVKAWNSVVKPQDVVLHLGDVSFGNKAKTAYYTLQLNGHKYLITGNHDSSGEQWFLDCGFTIIPPAFYVYHNKYDQRIPIVFTHEPIMILPDFWFNIHGHTHGDNHREIPLTNHHFDVSVDALENYKPIRLSTILTLFDQRIQVPKATQILHDLPLSR